MLQCPLVNLVGVSRAKRWLGKGFQVKVRPFSKLQVLPATQRGECVIVSGLQTLPEALLRFAPVFGKSRLPAPVVVFTLIRILQIFDPSRLYKPPSSLLGLAIPNLLFELSMGNLLSLNPKIHRLRADAQVHGRVADAERKFFPSE